MSIRKLSLPKQLGHAMSGYSVALTAIVLPAIVLTTVLLIPGHSWAQRSVATLTNSINAELGLNASTLQTLAFDYDPDGGLLYTNFEPTPGTTWTLELRKHSIRSDDFRVLVEVAGSYKTIPTPIVNTWRGTVLQEPGSRVYASYVNGRLDASIQLDAATYCIEPLAAPDTRHLIYDTADANFPDELCGVGGTATSGAPNGGITPSGTGLEIFEVAVDCDFEYYQDNNNSVINCVNSVENRMNQVAGVYEAPNVNLTVELTTIIVRSTGGTYVQSDDSAALNEFRSNWQNAPESSIRRDIAHLFTGRNLIGSLGIAYTFAACSNNGYGSSEEACNCSSATKTGLVAHEMGHNFGALHCDGAAGGCRIMCSGSGGCNGLSPLTFATQAAGAITSFSNGLSCLSPLLDPRPAPFDDEFPATTLSNANWSYNDGAVVNSNAVNEPSAPFALNLDSPGSNEFQYDEVRSNFILLQGVNNAVLEYKTQHRGVEAGETLTVYYLNSSLDWVEINTITSNGTDQSVFVQHSHVLPLNGRHNQFRVRFQTDGDGTSDDWYIDDVHAGAPTVVPPPIITSLSPNSGSVTGGTTVSIFGSDFVSNATVFWDSTPITTTFISSSELQVVTPPGSGVISLSVVQGSETAFLSGAFTYVSALLRLEDVDAVPGAVTSMFALGTHTVPIEGFSFGVDHDGDLITVLNVTDIGTDAEGSDFFAPALNTDGGPNGGWFTLGAIYSLQSSATIPAGVDNTLCRIDYEVQNFVPPLLSLPLEFRGDLNSPSVPLNFAAPGNIVIVPDLGNGSLNTVAAELFIRGDVNNSGDFQALSDSLFLLNFGFLQGAPPPCEKAADADDNGSITVLTDTLYLLNHGFSGGTPPPAPYPSAGVDPTPDSLTCTP